MKENLVQQARQIEAEAFIEKHRVTGGNTYDTKTRKVKIHCLMAGIPEKSIQVRLLEKAGVEEVVQSYMQLGIKYPMEILGIIWENAENAHIRRENVIIDLADPKSFAHIHMVCGGHRSKGMQVCHRMFPLKPLYRFLYITLLIVPRTRANIALLLYIGNSDNRKAQILVKTTQWSVVRQFRRALETIEEDSELSKQDKIDAFAAYKKETQPETGFTQNTCHTFSALCSVDKPIWDMLVRLFNGEYVVNKNLKGQKRPEAVTHFTAMSGIPTTKICAWLQRVLDGEWLTTTFLKRCNIWRKAEKVSGQTLEYICIQRPKYQFESMNDVAKVYPAVNDPLWFDGVVASCDDAVKSKLSTHAQKMIDEMMAEKEAEDKEAKVLAFISCFCFLVITINFFSF